LRSSFEKKNKKKKTHKNTISSFVDEEFHNSSVNEELYQIKVLPMESEDSIEKLTSP